MKRIVLLALLTMLFGFAKLHAACDGCLHGTWMIDSLTQGNLTTITTDTSPDPRYYTFITPTSLIILNPGGTFTISVGMIGRTMPIPHGVTVININFKVTAGDSCALTINPDPMGISGTYCWDSTGGTMYSTTTQFFLSRNSWDLDSLRQWFVYQCPPIATDTVYSNLQIVEDSLYVIASMTGLKPWQRAVMCMELIHRHAPYGLLDYDGNFDGNSLPWDSIKVRALRGDISICAGFSYMVQQLYQKVFPSLCYYRISLGNITNQQDVRGHVMGLFIVPTDTNDLWILVDPLVGTYLQHANGIPFDYREYLARMYSSPTPYTGDIFMRGLYEESLYRQNDSCLHGPYVLRGARAHPFKNTYMVSGVLTCESYFENFPVYDTLFQINMSHWGFSRPPIHMPDDTLCLGMLFRGIYGNSCNPGVIRDSLFGVIGQAVASQQPMSIDTNQYGDIFDEDQIHDNGFVVFPNPTTGILNVVASSSNTETALRFEISNLLGKYIFQDTMPSSGILQLDLHGNTAGMYFVTLIYSNGLRVTKKIFLN